MTIALPPQPATENQPVVIDGVSWETYERLLADVEGSGQNLRITYDEGRMTVVSPLPKHEKWKSLIGRFVEAIADEKEIPISTFGSSTWKRRDRQKGLEPDECFYVQHEAQVRDQLDIDLRRDPPPDLAIEIDIRRHAIDRLAVYAGLGVNEIWEYDGQRIQTLLLGSDGSYHVSETSAAFPFLRPVELKRFLDQFGTTDQNSLVRAVRQWARTL